MSDKTGNVDDDNIANIINSLTVEDQTKLVEILKKLNVLGDIIQEHERQHNKLIFFKKKRHEIRPIIKNFLEQITQESYIPNEVKTHFKEFKTAFLEATANNDKFYQIVDGMDFFTLGLIYYFYDKDYVKAKRAFHEALEKGYYKNEEIYARLGACYLKINDEAEALRFLTKATAANYPPSFYNLGLFYKSIRDYENAAKAFKQAFTIKPDYYLARNNYGTTLSKMGKHKDAIYVLEKLVNMKEDYYLAHYNLACSLCLSIEKKSISLKNEKRIIVKILEHLREAFRDVRYIVEARVDQDLSYINEYNSKYYPEFDTLAIFCTKKFLKK